MNKKNKNKLLIWQEIQTVSLLSECLNQEFIFLGSTDTILGIFSPATQKGRVMLDKLKGRQEKPYLLLINSLNCIKKMISNENFFQIEKIVEKFCPGPLTIIVRAQKDTPSHLVSIDGTIAFRIPKHAGIQKLLNEVPLIFSTSINKTGMPAAKDLEVIDSEFLEAAQYIVLNDIDKTHFGDEFKYSSLPSTIIFVDQGNIKLVRQGSILLESILSSV